MYCIDAVLYAYAKIEAEIQVQSPLTLSACADGSTGYHKFFHLYIFLGAQAKQVEPIAER